MNPVAAHVKGLEWLLEGKGSRVFNPGMSMGFSVQEAITECKAVTGQGVPHRFGPKRAEDCATLVSSRRRAAEELG